MTTPETNDYLSDIHQTLEGIERVLIEIRDQSETEYDRGYQAGVNAARLEMIEKLGREAQARLAAAGQLVDPDGR